MIGGITDIFSFCFGIPSVCGIRIGDCGHFEFESALQDKCTGDFTYDVPLEAYSAFIECDRDCEDTVLSIEVRMPFCDWNEKDIESMYSYLSAKFPYKERGSSYSYDIEDRLESVDAHLSNSLYSIRIYDEFNYNTELLVEIYRVRNESDVYRAMNLLSDTGSDEKDVWGIVSGMVRLFDDGRNPAFSTNRSFGGILGGNF